MSKTGSPRHGSMQFWPRVRAKRAHSRLRSHTVSKDSPLSGFAGYKVGMSQVQYVDTRKASPTKNETLSVPVTLIECPPLKIFSLRFYKKSFAGTKISTEVINPKLDKEVAKKIKLPKNIKTKIPDSLDSFSEIRLNVYTQPKMTGIGKKRPEIFELAISGSLEEQLNYAKENLDKEISVRDVIKPGQLVDARAITKGHGFQGAVRRFGVRIRSHKSEKGVRTAGSLGGWSAQQHVMYRIPHPGKMGFHQRIDFNKWVVAIKDPKDFSFFDHYGNPKNDLILIKGSLPGPKKRLIKLTHALRPNKKLQLSAPELK